jgi:transposase-like protein
VKLTLRELRMRVQDENDAYLLMEELRWHGTPVCPHCGNEKAWFLNPKNGTRGTGPKRADGQRSQSVRRVWKCSSCRKQFSVLTGTIFHGTKVAISEWLTVMVLMCSAKNGISAREVERLVGVTPETAWFMLHRLREAMKREPLVEMLSGVIVADETFIGGKDGNKSPKRREGARGHKGKTAVLTHVKKSTGEARSRVIPDVTGPTLEKAIREQVSMPFSILYTDEAAPYEKLGRKFGQHHTVNHSKDEYARSIPGQRISTNPAESFFSQLKRSLDGTHHHVSREHLHRYLAEFDFKYDTRKMDDPQRLQAMVNRVAGRRLSYEPLTGQEAGRHAERATGRNWPHSELQLLLRCRPRQRTEWGMFGACEPSNGVPDRLSERPVQALRWSQISTQARLYDRTRRSEHLFGITPVSQTRTLTNRGGQIA